MGNSFSSIDNRAFLGLAADLRAVAQERGQDAAVSMVDRAAQELGKGCFSLAVLGMVKRGKSTFCNALLGAKDDAYAPVGVNPVSNAVTIFRKGPPEVRVSFGEDGRPDELITKDRIRNFITEQMNPGNRLNVASISVQDEFPALPDGVVLVDTPGEGSMNQHHDQLLYKYLPSADAAIFLITAQSPLTESEVSFLKEIQAQDVRKIFFAINRADQVDEDEMREAVEHNLSVLAANGIPAAGMYPISAKLALKGDMSGSGFGPLFDAVRAYLAREKFRVPRERFMARILPLVDSLSAGIVTEIAARQKTAAELSAEIKELTDRGTSLEDFQKSHLQEVRARWDAAAAAFFAEVKSGLSGLEMSMEGLVRGSRAGSVRTLKAEFASSFESMARQKIETAIGNFESAIATALNALPVGFGGLNLDSGAEGSHKAFAGGASCGVGRLVLTGVLSGIGGSVVCGALSIACPPVLIALGAVAAQFWNTAAKVKDELLRELPSTVEKIRQYWLSQRSVFDSRRDELLAELEEQFRLQMEPTVQALQDALESQGKIDRSHDDRLQELKGMINAVGRVADDLGKDVEA